MNENMGMHVLDTPSGEDLKLSSLEYGQFSEAKKHHFPRRSLRGSQTLVLWSLRIYLLFMMAVVVYQIWSGAGS